MRFIAFTTLALSIISATVGLPTTKRYARGIEKSLKVVYSNLMILNNDVNAFPQIRGASPVMSALIVQNDASELNSAVESVTSATQGTPPLNEGDGHDIYQYVVGMLVPQLDRTLDNIVAKKPDFDKIPSVNTPSTPLVRQDLQTLRGSVTDLGMRLLPLMPADLHVASITALQHVLAALTAAINTYSE